MAPLFIIQRFLSFISTFNSLEMKLYLEYLAHHCGNAIVLYYIHNGIRTCTPIQRKSGGCQIMTRMENENITRGNHRHRLAG